MSVLRELSGGNVETVVTPATRRLLPRLFVLGFWARELDCFLLDLFVAAMRVSAVSWNQGRSEMRIVEEMQSWVSLRFD